MTDNTEKMRSILTEMLKAQYNPPSVAGANADDIITRFEVEDLIDGVSSKTGSCTVNGKEVKGIFTRGEDKIPQCLGAPDPYGIWVDSVWTNGKTYWFADKWGWREASRACGVVNGQVAVDYREGNNCKDEEGDVWTMIKGKWIR